MKLWRSYKAFVDEHKAKGGDFFGADRLRIMRRRVVTTGTTFDGRWLITREGERAFSVWECMDDGGVKLCGTLGAYNTAKTAQHRIEALHRHHKLPRKTEHKATTWREMFSEGGAYGESTQEARS